MCQEVSFYSILLLAFVTDEIRASIFVPTGHVNSHAVQYFCNKALWFSQGTISLTPAFPGGAYCVQYFSYIENILSIW